MKNWNDYIEDQKNLCNKYGINWIPADAELKVGIAANVLTGLSPVNGVRYNQENGTTGWYIWAGQEFSQSEDFFKPYCAKHLIGIRPEIVKYLGLAPKYRFIVDGNGYEDVWEDEGLLI